MITAYRNLFSNEPFYVSVDAALQSSLARGVLARAQASVARDLPAIAEAVPVTDLPAEQLPGHRAQSRGQTRGGRLLQADGQGLQFGIAQSSELDRHSRKLLERFL